MANSHIVTAVHVAVIQLRVHACYLQKRLVECARRDWMVDWVACKHAKRCLCQRGVEVAQN